MSGIAAIVHQSEEPIDESIIRLMAASMAIRGPDKQSYRLDRRVAFGQSTVDAQNRQDCHSFLSEEDIWITACARIDGRNELIAKLDHVKITDYLDDEQLIIQSYRQWGVNCLDHLIGDFAFILWDARHKNLFCATDQFGVAPLFYARTRHGLCLSNSLNSIRLHPDVNDELNEATIADYLVSRLNHTADTSIFKAIKRLPAGNKLLFQNGKITVAQYWSPQAKTPIQFKNPEEYLTEFSHLLRTAINDRLSTYAIGTDLSGGMDSTTVTAIAYDLLSETGQPFNLHAYTLGSNGLLDDLESSLASKVAESRNIEQHIYIPDLSRLVPEHIAPHLICPEPALMRRSTHQFSKLEHIGSYRGTLLTGFGGDPLLHGRAIGRHDIKSPVDVFSHIKQAIYHYQAFHQLPSLDFSNRTNPQSSWVAKSPPKWLSGDFIKHSGLVERLQTNQLALKTLNSSQIGMASSALWRRLFDWNDPGFTHTPVKVCHPFFDTRLLEFVLQLPPFPWRHKKYLLRKTMALHLPNAITERVKTPVPGNRIKALLDVQGLSDEASALLTNSHLDEYIDGKKLLQACHGNDDTYSINYKVLMSALTFSYWLSHYQTIPKAIADHSRSISVQKIIRTASCGRDQ